MNKLSSILASIFRILSILKGIISLFPLFGTRSGNNPSIKDKSDPSEVSDLSDPEPSRGHHHSDTSPDSETTDPDPAGIPAESNRRPDPPPPKEKR